jgi:hypothetical protein
MIYSCNNCCKSISSRAEMCPFCKTDVSEFSLLVQKRYREKREHRKSPLADMLQGTLAALKL